MHKHYTGKIKCQSCATLFEVDLDEAEGAHDDDESVDRWPCPSCSRPTVCDWYGWCPECDELVGFRRDPLRVVESVQQPSAPDAPETSVLESSTWGRCLVCSTAVVACPACDQVDRCSPADPDRPVVCSDCGSSHRRANRVLTLPSP